jgi:plastocyanin
MATSQPAAQISAGQRIRFRTADGATHTVTVARVEVQEVYLYTVGGQRFEFLGYEPVELLEPEELC